MAHYKITCRCGNTVSECRCFAIKKPATVVDHCDKCNTGIKWYIRHRVVSKAVEVELVSLDVHSFETAPPTRLGYYTNDSDAPVVLATYGPFDTEEAAKSNQRARVDDV